MESVSTGKYFWSFFQSSNIKYRLGRKCRRTLWVLVVSLVFCIVYYQSYGKVSRFVNSSVRIFGSNLTYSREQNVKLIVNFDNLGGDIECRLPKLNPFDQSIIEFIHSPNVINCEKKIPKLFRTNFESKLIHMKEVEDQSCCYRTMERKLGSDTLIRMSKKCEKLKSGLNIELTSEFITIFCNFTQILQTKNMNTTKINRNVTDMFAFVPTKPNVEKRLRNFKINQKILGKNLKESERLNVIFFGLDAQSRMNFIRQMPLTYDFITRNLSAIDLKGYTKVGDNTFPNLIPILTGLNVSELRETCWNGTNVYFDKCPFIWKLFSQHGYVTSYAEDSVWMGIFTYEKPGFWNQPTDYYLNPFMHQMSKKIGHEPLGNVKLCYGPRLGFEVLLDYIIKTSIKFKNTPYFQFIWANSLFHDYLNFPNLGDQALRMTLEFLQVNNLLNKTVLVLLSDHGIRWGGIRNTVQGRLEERMPMNYWIFPKWHSKKYSKFFNEFRKNSEKLTTPFDIHESLKNLLNMDEVRMNSRSLTQLEGHSTRGISLFRYIPTNRTCEIAGIEEHWCVCNAMEKVPSNLTIVETAGKFIISMLNQLLENEVECAKLKLIKIQNGARKSVNSSNGLLLSNQTVLQVTLVTEPGYAIFEATVASIDEQYWNLVGEISRLNLYKSQSWCISDFVLKKYCFCINNKKITDNEIKSSETEVKDRKKF